jgi:ABC-2 type transport system ATP-binding protein
MGESSCSIRARNLTRHFGAKVAVRNLSFDIGQGQIVGFLGPNGAGKSTTLRILTGALRATSGYAAVCGLPVPFHSREIRQKIGYMPENNPLPEDLRVIEYLRFRARIKGIPLRQRKARIEHALEVCELHRKARRQIIGTLSKGFRQRVGIADAILAAPPITILDEPTIGLDPHQVLGIRRLLNTLRGKTTVIFSSHVLSEVEISCDRILILNQGRLVASGTPNALKQEFSPGTRYRIALTCTAEEARERIGDIPNGWSLGRVDDQSQELTTFDALHPSADEAVGPLLNHLTRTVPGFLVAFQPQQPSLEEVFLKATRRSWDVDSAPILAFPETPAPQ